jgi:uncharacterized membrane protein
LACPGHCDGFDDSGCCTVSWRQIVEKYAVRYLYYGPNEQDSGGYDPSADPLWDVVYANNQVHIYRLVPER